MKLVDSSISMNNFTNLLPRTLTLFLNYGVTLHWVSIASVIFELASPKATYLYLFRRTFSLGSPFTAPRQLDLFINDMELDSRLSIWGDIIEVIKDDQTFAFFI